MVHLFYSILYYDVVLGMNIDSLRWISDSEVTSCTSIQEYYSVESSFSNTW